jgi:hypothetical protein
MMRFLIEILIIFRFYPSKMTYRWPEIMPKVVFATATRGIMPYRTSHIARQY